MSRAVWQHKYQSDRDVETWNLPELPDGFLTIGGTPVRLYVAIQGHWRGYFVLTRLLWQAADRQAPFALAFAPHSWTPINPQPAPPRPRSVRYTLHIPVHANRGTR
jgi:hypothetical protein